MVRVSSSQYKTGDEESNWCHHTKPEVKVYGEVVGKGAPASQEEPAVTQVLKFSSESGPIASDSLNSEERASTVSECFLSAF